MRRMTTALTFLAVPLALLLASCGSASQAPAEPRATLGELMAEYTRTGSGPYGTEIDITYAPAAFFVATGQEVPSGVRTSRELVFIYNESVHDGEILASAPVVLVDATGRYVQPTSAVLITEGGHHRSTRVVFAQDGKPPRSVTLLVLTSDGLPAAGGELTWTLGGAPTAAPQARRERP